MPVSRKRKSNINILKDITIKAKINDPNMIVTSSQNLTPRDVDKENIANIDYTIVDIENMSGRQRCTASMYFFDEEPVFSDSDEEREHTRNVLNQFTLISNEHPKKVNVEVQCNLLPHPTELLDLVERCGNFNPDDVNEEFRQLIYLCRQLNYKYQFDTPSSSVDERNTSINDDNFIEMHLKNQKPPTPNLENSNSAILPDFLPSREGSGNFSSETFTFGNGKFNEIVENKVYFLRRPRVKKPSQLNKSRFVAGKDRLIKSNKKSNKNVQCKTDNAQKNKPISLFKNKKNRIRERRKVEDIMLDFILRGKSRKANGKLCANFKHKGHLNNLAENIHVKLPLPKKQVRSLARNWMKPHKNVISQEYSVKLENAILKQRARRLYSPTEWLRSKDFATLCEKI